jgi:hypothetical protein
MRSQRILHRIDSGCQADMKRSGTHPNSSEEEHGIEPQRTNRDAEGARIAASSTGPIIAAAGIDYRSAQ